MGSSRTAFVFGHAIAMWGMIALSAGSAGAQGLCSLGPDNPIVRFETNLGQFEVLLCRANVPETVDNFVQYVNEGAYTNTGFVHRSIARSPSAAIDIIQGGGFYVDSGGVIRGVTPRPPIALQAVLPNRAGTIAMARTNQPDSATSQWFINVDDNPSLDPTGPGTGYAVFGEVISGMSVVDSIHSQEIWSLNPTVFATVPLINFPNDGVASPVDYFVYITSVAVVPEPAAAAQAVAALATLAALAAGRRRSSR